VLNVTAKQNKTYLVLYVIIMLLLGGYYQSLYQANKKE